MIVAVVGADGAGKSTVTGALAAALAEAGHEAYPVDRWDIVGCGRYPAARFMRPDAALARSCAATMPPTARFLFLMWTAVMAVRDGPGRPGIAVVDGHWAKHAASEVASGLEPDWVERVVAGLPRPDLTLYLRLDPRIAWRRKAGRAVPYECGMDFTCSEESFLRHQGRLLATLDRWSERYGWSVIDAQAPAAAVLAQAVQHVDAVCHAHA